MLMPPTYAPGYQSFPAPSAKRPLVPPSVNFRNNPGSFPYQQPHPDQFQPTTQQAANANIAEPLSQTPAIKRFAVLGDAGTADAGENNVATMMHQVFQQKPFASVVVLGDNVYPDGKPALFESCIHKPLKPLLDSGVSFYPVLGNHDVKQPDHGEAQLRYWNRPRYYNQRIGNVELFALDTTLFFPDYDHHLYKQPNTALQEGAKELAWLDQSLAKSTAKYKIVYGHYPMYSVNDGFTEMPGLIGGMRQLLSPILSKNHVDAYLGGHTHDYEKTMPLTPDGMVHFVSGAGGRVRTDLPPSVKPPIQKFIPQRHFMLFEDTPQGLRYQAIAYNGALMDSGIIQPKQQNQRKPGMPLNVTG